MRPAMSDGEKTCIDCGSTKPLDDFYRVYKGSEHRQSRCKRCDNRKRAGAHTGRRGAGVDVRRNADGSLTTVRR